LALTLALQAALHAGFSGIPFVQPLVVGSAVNLCLIAAVSAAGYFGGALTAVLTPVAASLTAGSPMIIVPFVALANLAFVTAFWFVRRLFKEKDDSGPAERGEDVSEAAEPEDTVRDSKAASGKPGGGVFKKRAAAAFFSGVTAGAVPKFLIMTATAYLIAPALVGSLGVKQPMVTAIQLNYSYPQLIAAFIGGILAYFVVAALEKLKLL
jgi:hypothetical protein